MSEKLQKLLANAGYGSRREIEKWIAAGQISVNGKRAKTGDRATRDDRILINGKVARFSERRHEPLKCLIYNKPEGQICTRVDNKGRETVFDNLPAIPQGRWVAVGRLDLNTSGLLLFTNNGELANTLMHPSSGLQREYLARVRGRLSEEDIDALVRKGVKLDGKLAKFESISQDNAAEQGTNHWYRVVICEGRYREVRRLMEHVGHPVSRLKRIRYGSVKLSRDIKLGQYSKMAPKQLEKLLQQAGIAEQFVNHLHSKRNDPTRRSRSHRR